jgi:hypothetical protein
MLKAIYSPETLPFIFNSIEPSIKLKTKYLEKLKIVQPSIDSTDEPILNISFDQSLTRNQVITYSTADMINKKGLRDVVPLYLVLQDYKDRLYLALTYVKFFAPVSDISPNQLNLFSENEK